MSHLPPLRSSPPKSSASEKSKPPSSGPALRIDLPRSAEPTRLINSPEDAKSDSMRVPMGNNGASPTQEARRRLEQSGYSALASLDCECADGVLVLRGHLSTYFLKQFAQTLVRNIPGVSIVVNETLVD